MVTVAIATMSSASSSLLMSVELQFLLLLSQADCVCVCKLETGVSSPYFIIPEVSHIPVNLSFPFYFFPPLCRLNVAHYLPLLYS